MDIVKVLAGKIHAEMQQHSFEINSVLHDPTKEGAMTRLRDHVQQYADLQAHLSILQKLAGEISTHQEEQPESNEN